jgi:hypothetical protein
MNSNFEWQKHQANERVQAKLYEAEIHRSLKLAKGQSPSIGGKIIRLPLIGLGRLARWVSQRTVLAPSDEQDDAIVSAGEVVA